MFQKNPHKRPKISAFIFGTHLAEYINKIKKQATRKKKG